MANTYTFSETNRVGQGASAEITSWLTSLPETILVVNVEKDKAYQVKDIDLLWLTESGTTTIEIKADRYHKTNNFYLEEISNTTKNTPGCILYTESDYIYYYFVTPRELFIIPTAELQEWFKENKNNYSPKFVNTKAGIGTYSSMGRAVPKDDVIKAIPDIKKHIVKL